MNYPAIQLTHLDNLWFQVSGTLCNIACAHCFNNSGPNVKTFGFLSLDTVLEEIRTAAGAGVREIFFTGGEPFLTRSFSACSRSRSRTHPPRF